MSSPGLVKHIPHVCLRLSEPHGEQLRALDGDEVGLALVSDGLGEQRLTAAYNGNKILNSRIILKNIC